MRTIPIGERHERTATVLAHLTEPQRAQLLTVLSSFAIEDLEPADFHVEILADYVAGTISADVAAQRIAAARAAARDNR